MIVEFMEAQLFECKAIILHQAAHLSCRGHEAKVITRLPKMLKHPKHTYTTSIHHIFRILMNINEYYTYYLIISYHSYLFSNDFSHLFSKSEVICLAEHCVLGIVFTTVELAALVPASFPAESPQ